jgi:hypothetical protein
MLVYLVAGYQDTGYPGAGYPDAVYPDANFSDWLSFSGKFVENSIKPNCPEITGYRMKYSTALWLLELQMRRGRKV